MVENDNRTTKHPAAQHVQLNCARAVAATGPTTKTQMTFSQSETTPSKRACRGDHRNLPGDTWRRRQPRWTQHHNKPTTLLNTLQQHTTNKQTCQTYPTSTKIKQSKLGNQMFLYKRPYHSTYLFFFFLLSRHVF